MTAHTVKASGLLKGKFVPPGDKSISHRALMFGALADGRSSFAHFLDAADCISTMDAFKAMGVPVEFNRSEKTVVLDGVGLRGLKEPKGDLYLGNSGTSMRLLLGILSGQRFEATLNGDESLSSRPMKRVTKPLKQMGAQIKGRDDGNFSPITIRGGKLKGIDYDNELSSAQVKSAILFAGLHAEGPTRVREAIPSRDHTEKYLEASGARFQKKGEWLIVEKTDRLQPLSFMIPGDISAAAFFIAGAAMTPGSEITVENVCLNPTRTGILDILRRMGAKIEIQIDKKSPELVGKIGVRGGRLKGTRITKSEIPSLIDELPILMTAMACAEGESIISGAEELRVKETDRIFSMVHNLNAVGGNLQELPDGCIIKGVSGFREGKVKSFGDHRTAMSMAIASLALKKGEIAIEDTECIHTSFPQFFEQFGQLKSA